jgi:hypothetical protein
VTYIKIDIDSRELERAVFQRLDVICAVLTLHRKALCVTRTRHGWHVIVQVSETIHPQGIVAIQAICGSDWRRETYTLQKARRLHAVDAYWRDRFNTTYVARS